MSLSLEYDELQVSESIFTWLLQYFEAMNPGATVQPECLLPKITLGTPYDFLEYDSVNMLISLNQPADLQSETTFDDAFLFFEVTDRATWTLPITLEVLPCVVESLLFTSSKESLTYAIGSGPSYFTLPSLTQSPDCGLTFDAP